jgi:hypothetical protein
LAVPKHAVGAHAELAAFVQKQAVHLVATCEAESIGRQAL